MKIADTNLSNRTKSALIIINEIENVEDLLKIKQEEIIYLDGIGKVGEKDILTFLKDKTNNMDNYKDLIKTINNYECEKPITIMCECAFGDTPDELQLMSKTIKEIVRAGSVVHIIK